MNCEEFKGNFSHLKFNNNFNCILIIFSQFISCNSLNGGALYISLISSSIVETLFFNCSSKEYGGSIYFQNSDLIINKCCNINSFSKNGQFGWFVALNTSSLLFFNFSTICYSSYNFKGDFYVFYTENGNLKLNNLNSSKNKLNIRSSGFEITRTFEGNINFCTCHLTHSNSDICVNTYAVITCNFFYLNLINNTQSTNNYGIIH